MRLFRAIVYAWSFLSLIGLMLVGPSEAAPRATQPTPVDPPQACVQAPHDKLCSYIPHDVVTTFGNGYSQLSPLQRPFDNFSWQSFVSLNWPADKEGKPLMDSITTHPEAPRVWEFYATPFDVFGHAEPELKVEKNDPEKRQRVFHMMSTRTNEENLTRLQTDSFLEATGQALIDRNLNFALYDIVMNPDEVEYIKQQKLDTKVGQQAFKGTVSFPLGFYDNPAMAIGGKVGAIEIKTAWRILDPNKDKDEAKRYYTVEGEIYIDAKYSVTGKPLLLHEKMGLVGMHILHRTTGPYKSQKMGTFPQDWIWSTFEHVDNAPLAGNALDPTNISLPLPATATPPNAVDRKYSFFNPDYKGPTNVPPMPKKGESTYKWEPMRPYASRYANDNKYGTQVVRSWKIYPGTNAVNGTDEVNRYFQNLLKGTVWANYQLVGSQWMGGNEDPKTENGNIPRYLSNATLETYIQLNSQQQNPPVPPEGSCLHCHQSAKMTTGKSANFSFLLGRAR